MMTIRPAHDRGHANFGWLDSHHTFSFGEYFDEANMGFGPLRVINDDVIAPSRGFDMHPHRDMEIITYVLDGSLAHRDSLGNGSVITPGEVQIMSAGTGIRHSEYNASDKDPVRLLQIWILPEAKRLAPRYDQRAFALDQTGDKLTLVGSNDGRDGSVVIHAPVDMYAARPSKDSAVRHTLAAGRTGWLQVATGQLDVNGQVLNTGDGVAFATGADISIRTVSDSAEFLLFDMAA